MAKLIRILAASVGGGLVLGAGIRLGEALGSSARRTDKHRLKSAPPAEAALRNLVARIDRQQSEMEAIRDQVSRATRALDSVSGTAENLRNDLHQQLSEEMDRRLSNVEERLHLRMKTANTETTSAVLSSIETRVAPRISQLENEINSQSAALADLRDCSLESERTIMRLLTVLERITSQKPETAGTAAGLTVVSTRGPDEQQAGGSGVLRRPVTYR